MAAHRRKALLPTSVFIFHMVRNAIFGLFMIIMALFMGMVGYHSFERMSWVDAFCNASMILSGMGPVSTLQTTGGKLFAGFYALFSGLIFIMIVGVMFAPLFQRFFHKMHLDMDIKEEP
jgi:hypothetical protein